MTFSKKCGLKNLRPWIFTKSQSSNRLSPIISILTNHQNQTITFSLCLGCSGFVPTNINLNLAAPSSNRFNPAFNVFRWDSSDAFFTCAIVKIHWGMFVRCVPKPRSSKREMRWERKSGNIQWQQGKKGKSVDSRGHLISSSEE